MASSSSSISLTFALILVLLRSISSHANNGCYSSIFSFGDSLADTGNLKQLASISDQEISFFSAPYGENFFNQSTGRCSNGRLIIDFLAESLGLPLIPPYLQNNGSDNVVPFKHGVNYAVAGASALDPLVLEPGRSLNLMTNTSLRVQLAWFNHSLPFICGHHSNCSEFIGRSLILVGEIGGNDYNYPILEGKPIKEVELFVPRVIDAIMTAINDLIEMGAKTLFVPGNFPIGCSVSYLTVCGSENAEYDSETGCLVQLNKFVEYHNELLQTKLNQVQELHPDVNIIYGDYYNAAMEIYRFPYKFGFTNGALKACCGGEGPYNVDTSVSCGDASATVCDEPDTYVSWDGMHLTEAAYRVISKSLFSTLQFTSLCSASTSGVGLSI